jgi:chaperonin GroES
MKTVQKNETVRGVLYHIHTLYRFRTFEQRGFDMAEKQKKIQLNPLGNRVLVRRLENKETTKGSIILPDTAKKKQEMAEVLAVGPGTVNSQGVRIVPPVQVGACVLIDKYSGQEVTIDDDELIVVRGEDIVAIVER